MLKHYDIHISGKVQTVGYRYSACEEAKKLALTGFAKNEADGSVYIEVEGDVVNLDLMIAWCRQGPQFAKVKSVVFQESPELKNFSAFSIF